MCGRAGIILGGKRRRAGERDHLAWLFTRLLAFNERRGPHATGVAWLKCHGRHKLFKRPVRAGRFVLRQGVPRGPGRDRQPHHAALGPHPPAHARRREDQ